MEKINLKLQQHLDRERAKKNKDCENWCRRHYSSVPDAHHSKATKVCIISSPIEPVAEDEEDDDGIENGDNIIFNTNKTHDYTFFPEKWKQILRYTKLAILIIFWLLITIILMRKTEIVPGTHQINVAKGKAKSFSIFDAPKSKKLEIMLDGAMLPEYYRNLSQHSMDVWVEGVVTSQPANNNSNLKEANVLSVKNISELWRVPLVSDTMLEQVPQINLRKALALDDVLVNDSQYLSLRIKLKTNLDRNLPLSLEYHLASISTNDGVIYAAFVLLGLYVIIIFEIIHRTLAAMLASTISIAILAYLNVRPALSEIVSWIDTETLLLLFSMMIIVTIVSETGLFDYLAVLAFKVTNGKEWPLINTLCLFTVFLSCFLDSVTTALLLTPVTIRLCEVMKLNPVPVLISMVIYSNVGGAITPVGDPPNVIIASNKNVVSSGVNFAVFTLHMGIGVLLSSIVIQLLLHFFYKDDKDFKVRDRERQEVSELKREIAVWQRAVASVSSYSKDEDVVKESMMKRTSKLMGKLQTKTASCSNSNRDPFEDNLEALQNQYRIRNKPLLIKSGIVLLFVIPSFFLHSVPEISHLGMGWTAFLGALLLLILYDKDNLDSILARVEWSTLIFFASLFILMEALSRLGLIDWIGQQTESLIMSVHQESRLAVAILLILWVSAGASAFVDNIPLTTMMVKISVNLSKNAELKLPLQPLVWALSFGACFGGNGSLFGSSSNIICAGVAEQHGYKFSFTDFFKVGFPIMVASVLVVTIYLIVAHAVFEWN
ncbi:P protein-like isoform X2 [Agrilus planipennis]|uniref:P protein-like isoform X2 n=1 Tax=Agrilus planipennis TaxID=224129 RepID=A0A7F5QZL6_AGRPL|nr:P protein-like isoform X2 [Agrilus planipennis]